MGVDVDPAFVQSPEHRPDPTVVEASGIPQIDLSPLLDSPILDSGDASPQALSDLLAEVDAACRDWGFFQVINHGVPSELVERVEAAARVFFAMPAEEKRTVRRDEVNPLGYYEAEHTKNVRDWKEVFDFVVEEPAVIPSPAEHAGVGVGGLIELWNQWPKYPAEFR
ncbi:putative 2-oxoglutarate-dependent dioxygenase [Cocos nucifera]|nr:putative 2-oxoglutarate-dependent dioxygenase [Cocos nucifera]